MAVNRKLSVSAAAADNLPSGYKRTECGVVPEEWTVDTVGSLFELQNGVNADKSAYGSGMPFVNVLEVITHPKLAADHIPGRVVLKQDLVKIFRVAAGDVLFNRTSETQDEVGLASVYVGSDDVVFGGFVIRGRARDRELNPSVVSLLLRMPAVRHQIVARGQGVVRSNIGQAELGRVHVPIPPRAEQRAIAEALSDADSLIASLSLLLAKKRNIKQGAMQELLSGKNRLPGFTGRWQLYPLGSFLRLQVGFPFPSSGFCGRQMGLRLIRNRDLKSDDEIVHFHGSYSDEYIVRPADVLIGMDGDFLPCRWRGSEALLNQRVGRIVPSARLDPSFAFYMLIGKLKQIEAATGSTTVKHLSHSDVEGIVCRMPELAEQSAIGRVLSNIDADIEALESLLTKARQLKQGMMQELLTGRIRLVRPATAVIPLANKITEAKSSSPGSAHNWQINEAVVIGVLAQSFGTEKFPLPRKRRVKLMYLLHRYAEGLAKGDLKRAAGPYDPNTKYKGPEAIALNNGYVRAINNGKYEGFVAGDNAEQAHGYFDQWYGLAKLDWLERFHYRKTDDLELLATVDMAMMDLVSTGQPANLASIKRVIAAHTEWAPKLSRELFSDEKIALAIAECQGLFDN
ncbi:MAG TPA: restriction endonuclease subunit S [Steroidobacteraceae bacterium]|nr:restriction endonuclease subunit S [Steroidobacteraceae bacterium]